MMPDRRQASCCGWADAYECIEDREPDGKLVCVITDTRPDTRTLPDGRVLNRKPIPVGTRVRIPPEKIRRPPIPNPTDTAIVFVSRYGDVFCYEPTPGI